MAEQLGYHSQVILSGRRINDYMGKYVAENLVKLLIQADVSVKNAKVALLGFTFKENCPDTRNTRVIDIVNELKEYGVYPIIADPVADIEEAEREYGISFVSISSICEVDAIILAVAHSEFLSMTQTDFDKFFLESSYKGRVLLDIKGILDRSSFENAGYIYWRL
jgi:UDP-N-acetyl-D-galactosamine dehydrogenase